MPRRTKIVATIGPASDSPEALAALVEAGIDVARLNLSHGTIPHHEEVFRRLRKASDEAKRPIGVLADLPGPKVRSGVFPEGGVFLHEGTKVMLVPGDDACSDMVITVEYPSLLEDVRIAYDVILGDGAITLHIEDVGKDAAIARVVTGGRAQGRPGVHIPSERMRLTAPTAEDLELLDAMVALGVDFVAVSFVRRASDLATVRAKIGSDGPMIVAKIETAPAVADLPAILEAADAVMVARGDLGIECPIEEVPHVQKHVIRSCVSTGVPVITATQMLESMITAPTPTRAEVSDVANAVFDGTDALMLSAETAIGHDPAGVVETMSRIAERAEAEADYGQWATRLGRTQRLGGMTGNRGITRAMTHAAWQAATDVNADALLCCTRSGLTARNLARFRPGAKLISLSPGERTARQLTLSWGVQPLLVDYYRSTDEMVWFAVETSVKAGLVKKDDLVAVLAGAPDANEQATDVLRLVRVR